MVNTINPSKLIKIQMWYHNKFFSFWLLICFITLTSTKILGKPLVDNSNLSDSTIEKYLLIKDDAINLKQEACDCSFEKDSATLVAFLQALGMNTTWNDRNKLPSYAYIDITTPIETWVQDSFPNLFKFTTQGCLEEINFNARKGKSNVTFTKFHEDADIADTIRGKLSPLNFSALKTLMLTNINLSATCEDSLDLFFNCLENLEQIELSNCRLDGFPIPRFPNSKKLNNIGLKSNRFTNSFHAFDSIDINTLHILNMAGINIGGEVSQELGRLFERQSELTNFFIGNGNNEKGVSSIIPELTLLEPSILIFSNNRFDSITPPNTSLLIRLEMLKNRPNWAGLRLENNAFSFRDLLPYKDYLKDFAIRYSPQAKLPGGVFNISKCEDLPIYLVGNEHVEGNNYQWEIMEINNSDSIRIIETGNQPFLEIEGIQADLKIIGKISNELLDSLVIETEDITVFIADETCICPEKSPALIGEIEACWGNNPIIELPDSENNINFQLLQNGIPVGEPILGNGGRLSFRANPIDEPSLFQFAVLTPNSTCSFVGKNSLMIHPTANPELSEIQEINRLTTCWNTGTSIELTNVSADFQFQLESTDKTQFYEGLLTDGMLSFQTNPLTVTTEFILKADNIFNGECTYEKEVPIVVSVGDNPLIDDITFDSIVFQCPNQPSLFKIENIQPDLFDYVFIPDNVATVSERINGLVFEVAPQATNNFFDLKIIEQANAHCDQFGITNIVNVRVRDDISCIIGNTIQHINYFISPGDGVDNEEVEFSIAPIDFTQAKLIIEDYRGRTVYINNDCGLSCSWDGKDYKTNQVVSTGIYFYFIDLGNGKTQNGYITVANTTTN